MARSRAAVDFLVRLTLNVAIFAAVEAPFLAGNDPVPKEAWRDTLDRSKEGRMSTTRRQVLRSAGLLGAVLFSRGLVACSGDLRAASEDVEESEEALVRCAAPVIGANHGHRLVVTSADVEAGVVKTYSIRGTSGHDHSVTITAAEFAELAAGRSITVVSTSDAGHTHSVTVSCAVGGADASAGDAGGADASPPGDASSSDAGATQCGDGATAAAISANHGHVLVVPSSDVTSGLTRTYSMRGSSSHPHEVTITAAQFAELRSGATLTLTSTTDAGHAHGVKVVCA